ncbi:MAG: hypothetical protein U9Q66_04090 [Patescibacteria group bacterium]|nr:hypothetical protein [Patescibacteria group bacterium]
MKKLLLLTMLAVTPNLLLASNADLQSAKKEKLRIMQADANCNHLSLDIEVRRSEGENITVRQRMEILKKAQCFKLFPTKSCAFLNLDIEEHRQKGTPSFIVESLNILSNAGCKNPYK